MHHGIVKLTSRDVNLQARTANLHDTKNGSGIAAGPIKPFQPAAIAPG